MRAYVGLTGFVFFLIVGLHIWRMYAEHWGPAREPIFVVLTLFAAGMGVWSMVLLRRA
jgi:hypothetical protein